MERRHKKISADPILYVAAVSLCVAMHWGFFSFSPPPDWFDLFPLAFVTIAYIGYKFGRTPAIAAGVFCCVVWWVLDVWQYRLQGVHSVTGALAREIMSDQGLQHLVILTGTGYLSARLFDWAEQKLSEVNLSIGELIPAGSTYVVDSLVEKIGKILSTDPNEKTESSAVSSDAKIEFSGMRPKFQFTILFKNMSVLILFIIVALASLELSYFMTDNMMVRPLPQYTSVVLFGLFAYFKGFYKIAISLLLTIFPLSVATKLFFQDELPDMIGTQPAFASFTVLVVTIVGIWWLTSLKKAWQDDTVREKLKALKKTVTEADYSANQSITMGAVIFLLPLCLIVELDFTSRYAESFVGASYGPSLFVFGLVVFFTQYYRSTTVSNLIFFVTILFGLQSTVIFSSGLAGIDNLTVSPYSFNAFEVLVLALTPRLILWARPSSLMEYRVCTFGFIIIFLWLDLILDGNFAASASLRIFLPFGIDLIVTLLLQIVICDFLARTLHWSHKKSNLNHAT